MCGRRKVDRDFPELALKYADMDFSLVNIIAKQLPSRIVVQFHSNGEGLLYPRFGEATRLFKKQIKCITTNGLLLLEKANEVIDNLDTIAISIIQNEIPEIKERLLETIKKFLAIKGDKKPFLIYRLLGDVGDKEYQKLPGIVVRRVLHAPMGNFGYKEKRNPTIPEIGICLELLNHLCIAQNGEVSICVRFDPKRVGVIGNIKKQSLVEIWNGAKRRKWIEYHKKGQRDKVPLCGPCQFWGVPI
ncbi:MAG: SPASM domain-containing protein [Candidatus Azambacteria bacterium]|nr:SPASM domain-containing protein [Candidatus Azambacteria bacterium]